MDNKTIRRISVLNNILTSSFLQKKSAAATTFENSFNKQIEINKCPPDLQKEFNIIFTPEALTFLSKLITTFDQKIDQLHFNRIKNKIKLQNDYFELPKFLNTNFDKKWIVDELPERLRCRNIDLGDVSPANTEHFFQSLKTENVQGIQVDFDDGHCPIWRNQIKSFYNIYSVIHELNHDLPPLKNLPVLMLRPRAWNMIEHNIIIDGKKAPGPLVDFGLLMFHNGKKLTTNKSGPYFYLSKLENANEAKLWNEIFIWTQNQLKIKQGTIKVCVLIENILSSFEMNDILYELKEHCIGLNCGIWDYAASIINKFGDRKQFLLPDRNKYVNMEKHFLKKYMELVIQICHMRGALATGGMAAQLLTNENKTETINNVIRAKSKEIEAGCDGFLIYDRKLIPHIKKLWNRENKLNLQNINVVIKEADLLQMPEGTITTSGLKHNIEISILFIYNWFKGKGHFFYKGYVEDSATAEISRSQIWQWIRHKGKLEENGITITKQLVENLSNQFIKECDKNYDIILIIAKEMFLDVVTARYFVEFITTYLNDNAFFRAQTMKL